MPTSAAPATVTEGPREVELKLELDARDAARLAETSLVRGSQGRADALSTIYFDTKDFDLREAGLSLRVREVAGRRIQTIKAKRSAAAGLFDRDEWEQEVDGDGPDLKTAAGTALEPVLAGDGVRDGIRPIFAIRVDRLTYPLTGEAWTAELTLDQGEVEAEGRTSALCEIELELQREQALDLFAIARTLSEELPVRLGVRTKADRGYALVENKPLKALKAKGSGVVPGMTTAAAFQAIGRACLYHLMSNERVLSETRDPEVVHQMRVAMRRLRAAISLFKDVLADERRDAIRNELKWISNELGAARDLDVFIGKTLEPVRKKHPDEPGLESLVRSFQEQREQAYDRALAAVASQRFRTLVIDTAAWIEAGSWVMAGEGLERAKPVEAFAAKQLARRRKKVRNRGADLADLDPHARHQVRIEVKKLRYATEFFSPVYEGRKARKRDEAFLSALESLQEHLGELNDLAVSQEMHPDWYQTNTRAEGGDPHQRDAGHLIVKHQTARADAALKPTLKAYREFAEAKRFWT
jgi:inorganic triphosphatase YgiF